MNSGHVVGYASQDAVLIDTWWNVNDIGLLVFRAYFGVLIDTWWNVNPPAARY